MSGLPKHLKEIRDNVFIEKSAPVHTAGLYDSQAFRAMGVDNTLSLEKFKDELSINVVSASDECVEVDIIGIDAPIANALRRILISEIPTMAIEKVNLYNNTSIFADEVLAHRLGLVPIRADARCFRYLDENEGVASKDNTLVFTLNIACSRNKTAAADAPESELYTNANVYSRDLKWVPQGDQAERFADDPPRPVHDDILIAQLRPGQMIEAELLVEKGIGYDHAKWSPVCTAFYRLLPEIVVDPSVRGKLAEQLVALCPQKVFDVEDVFGGKEASAKVSRPRECTMCRECIREHPWNDRVKLRRARNHYLFTIESVGQYRAQELLSEALKTLADKCRVLNDCLNELGSHAS